MQCVTFNIGDRLYGMDIRMVKEINPTCATTPVPRSGPAIRGLVNIRGQVVLVIDVAVVLGLEPGPVTPLSHLVIFKTASELGQAGVSAIITEPSAFGDKPVGFLADRIAEVIAIEPDRIESAQMAPDGQSRHFYRGVVNLGRETLVLLDPEQLLLAT